MNKIKKLVFILTLLASVGVAWTVITLKNIPETFDWEIDSDS